MLRATQSGVSLEEWAKTLTLICFDMQRSELNAYRLAVGKYLSTPLEQVPRKNPAINFPSAHQMKKTLPL